MYYTIVCTRKGVDEFIYSIIFYLDWNIRMWNTFAIDLNIHFVNIVENEYIQ